MYSTLKFLKLNINDLNGLNEVFKMQNFRFVIHLAAQAGVRYSIDHPHEYIQSNIVGFANILECCRHHRIEHLLYASSSSVYGNSNEIPFTEEQSVNQPISLYAATKISNELMAYAYSHLYNFRTTGLRFFTVYGPWGRPDMAPMLFANAIVKNEPIKVYNNGDMLRDFTYIDDITEGIHQILDFDSKSIKNAEVFNLGNSKPIKLLDFIKILEKEIKIKSIKRLLPMQDGDVKMTYADTSKLLTSVGYQPRTSLNKGIENFVKWYQEYYKLTNNQKSNAMAK